MIDKVKQAVPSVSSTPSTSSSASKKTLKSEFKGKQTISSDEKDIDDDIEILDDDDDDDKPIRFDMKALSLSLEDETKISSSKTATSVKSGVPSSASKLSSKTLSKHKRIDVLEEYKKRSADKVTLNLVVVGEYVN